MGARITLRKLYNLWQSADQPVKGAGLNRQGGNHTGTRSQVAIFRWQHFATQAAANGVRQPDQLVAVGLKTFVPLTGLATIFRRSLDIIVIVTNHYCHHN